jgi:hypothetical protein
MAQAMLEQRKLLQKVNENSEKNSRKDSGVEMDEQEDLGNLNIQEKLGLSDEKQVILTGKHIKIRVCEIGNLYMDSNKTLKCTKASDCNVQLHRCQGVLSDHTDSPLDQYKVEINVALMIRITKDIGGCYRECLLCNKKFEKGKEILQHTRQHGGELGKNPTLPSTIVTQLEKLDMRQGENKSIPCGDCSSEQTTPLASVFHRVRFHKEFYDSPSICDFCQMPLFYQTFDQHFECSHLGRCCGEILKTAGQLMQHLLNKHPQKFEKEMGLENLPGFFLFTKNCPKNRELPWGDTVRETSKKINNFSWNRRDNGTPGAKTEKFRKHYLTGPSQNPMQDNILVYTANFEIEMSLKNATPGRVLIETEKLMMRFLAERHVEYIKKQDLSKENPLKSELDIDEVLVVCEECMERADHTNSKDKCIKRKKYSALTYSFTNGLVDDELVNLHHGILIGVNTGWYAYSSPGQYSFLNLGSRCWNPGFITGYKGEKGLIF